MSETQQKPSKGQTKARLFKVAGFQIRGAACRGGKDSEMRYCCVDFYDFKKHKRRMFCCCSIDDEGERAAAFITRALNAAWAKKRKGGAK